MTLRTVRRAATLVVAATAVVVATAGGAGADSGDFTCSVYAAVVATPATDLGEGQIYGVDAAVAAGTCVSDQGGSATATLSLWIEYQPYDGGSYVAVPGCYATASTSPAVSGVNVLGPMHILCTHRADGPSAGRPRRAHSKLVHSSAPTREYHGYSPVLTA